MPTVPFLIDAHSHIPFRAFKDDAAEVIARAEKEGIWQIAVGSQIDTSRRAVEYTERYEHIWAVVGLHPTHLVSEDVDWNEVGEEGKDGIAFRTRAEVFDPAAYRALAMHPKTVGIGECGMDFYRMPSSVDTKDPFAFSHENAKGSATVSVMRRMQEETFRSQIALAQEISLPLMVHVRDAVPAPLPPRVLGGVEPTRNDNCLSFREARRARRCCSESTSKTAEPWEDKGGRGGNEQPQDLLSPSRSPSPQRGEGEDQSETAHEATIRILGDTYGVWDGVQPRGMIHCYSGTWDQAQRYLALGFNISFTGVITFAPTKKQLPIAEELWRTVRGVPLDRFHVETDCPYLTPEPHRGERNEPRFVRHVAEKIAELRSESLEVIAAASVENTLRLFRKIIL